MVWIGQTYKKYRNITQAISFLSFHGELSKIKL